MNDAHRILNIINIILVAMYFNKIYQKDSENYNSFTVLLHICLKINLRCLFRRVKRNSLKSFILMRRECFLYVTQGYISLCFFFNQATLDYRLVSQRTDFTGRCVLYVIVLVPREEPYISCLMRKAITEIGHSFYEFA